MICRTSSWTRRFAYHHLPQFSRVLLGDAKLPLFVALPFLLFQDAKGPLVLHL